MAASFEFYQKKLKDPRKNITIKYLSTQKSMKIFSNEKTNLHCLYSAFITKAHLKNWKHYCQKLTNRMLWSYSFHTKYFRRHPAYTCRLNFLKSCSNTPANLIWISSAWKICRIWHLPNKYHFEEHIFFVFWLSFLSSGHTLSTCRRYFICVVRGNGFPAR